MEMKQDQMIELLSCLLDCGYADIDILAGCEYDFSDLIDEIKSYDGKVDVNSMAYEMFSLAKNDIRDWIDNRMEDLSHNSKEYKALKELDPQEDIRSFHNYLDTSAWIENNKEIYEKYCAEAVRLFEEKTGFSLN